ncbi:MAG: hypothetical protein OEM60_14435 [Gammaproteobacteria bacterium]|nr:hypothetical protein [Gammaproteobacteria bacterium]
MNHRIARLVFAFGVGVIVAVYAFKWITDPAPRAERELEEAVVSVARQNLEQMLQLGAIEVVDPLAPDRKVGKSYVYRAADGWQVSGFYRRGEGDRWHPFLLTLDASPATTSLKVQDAELVDRAKASPILEAIP